jgi:hypothetical protein
MVPLRLLIQCKLSYSTSYMFFMGKKFKIERHWDVECNHFLVTGCILTEETVNFPYSMLLSELL